MSKNPLCKCRVPLFETMDDGSKFCTTCNREVPPETAERLERSSRERPGFHRGARVRS